MCFSVWRGSTKAWFNHRLWHVTTVECMPVCLLTCVFDLTIDCECLCVSRCGGEALRLDLTTNCGMWQQWGVCLCVFQHGGVTPRLDLTTDCVCSCAFQCGGEAPRLDFTIDHCMWQQWVHALVFFSVEGKLMAEGLHLLLCLNLARGHVAALVRTIRHFYGNSPCSVVQSISFRNVGQNSWCFLVCFTSFLGFCLLWGLNCSSQNQYHSFSFDSFRSQFGHWRKVKNENCN